MLGLQTGGLCGSSAAQKGKCPGSQGSWKIQSQPAWGNGQYGHLPAGQPVKNRRCTRKLSKQETQASCQCSEPVNLRALRNQMAMYVIPWQKAWWFVCPFWISPFCWKLWPAFGICFIIISLRALWTVSSATLRAVKHVAGSKCLGQCSSW